MNRPRSLTAVVGSAVAALLLWLVPAASRGEIAFEAAWRPVDYAAVREQVFAWMEDANLEAAPAERIRRLWPRQSPADAAGPALLDRLAESFAIAAPEAAELFAACNVAYQGPAPLDHQWLADVAVPPLMRHNLRLFYARWLAQHGLYDEVLQQVGDLRPSDVIDPASLLFYQMVAYHQLVRPEESRAALVELLEQDEALPRRFLQVAQLVERDLSALEDESLDHIARRMHDIRRRLSHGRAGAKVQEVEQGVLDSLDKKIENLEKQQQQQQAAAASGGAPQSSRPMEDSRPAELKAPMQVDRRDIGSRSGWGDLPPKEREQALQQIGREFPAHYRELVEQYFRELANESSPPSR